MMRRDKNGNFRKSKSRNRKEWAVILAVLMLVVFGMHQMEQIESAAVMEETTVLENTAVLEEAAISENEQVTLNLHAAGAVLMDGYTGRVLYEKNASQVLPMASTTKIMTCIVALEYGNLEDLVEVSAYAASMPDVQLNINKGEQYRLENLLLSLMLESHNDAAAAIAEHIAAISLKTDRETIKKMWTEEEWEQIEAAEAKDASQRSLEESKVLVSVFAGLMNQKAESIGCENTCFITPNGLDAEGTKTTENGRQENVIHSTTARELALIMRYCLSGSEQSQKFTELTQTRSVSFTDEEKKRSFSCNNHNSYLDMKDGAVSGKTGFTSKAGYCYVGAVNQDGIYLIVALLACGWPPSKTLKWQDMNTLVNYGLENYSFVQIKGVEEDPSDYLVPVRNAKGKETGMEKIETTMMFEPFSMLIKEGESLSGNWYLECKDAEESAVVGTYHIMVGKTICRSFDIQVSRRKNWSK